MSIAIEENLEQVVAPTRSIWDGEAEATLALALKPPTLMCVERSLGDCMFHGGSDEHALGLAITTKAVFRHPVARVFADEICARVHASETLGMRIVTVLHEAVMNAALHGNLGLNSSLRNNFEGMAELDATIAQLLDDESVAGEMISIQSEWSKRMIYLLVRDSGAGFVRTTLPSPPEANAEVRGSGRGIAIVEAMSNSVEFLDAGRAIRIGFEL